MASSHDTAVTTRSRERWADTLRVVLIAGVVVVHTATAYVIDIPWHYDDERTGSTLWAVVLGFPVVAGGAFGLGPLFLLAGWWSVGSVARRGVGGFVRARLLRLGVPLLATVLLLEPLADYIGNLRSERGSFAFYLRMTEVSVMWFVAAILVFSLAYAGLRHVRPAPPPRRAASPYGVVVAAAAAISVSSFAVWQVWPWNAEVFLNLRLGEWPQGAVLFALGVHAARSGLVDDLPWPRARRLGWVAAGAAVALSAVFGVEVGWGDVDDLLLARALGPTLLFALLDGVVAVTWTLWCVAWFRRRWSRHGALLDRAARGAYATYLLHPVVLTTLMVLFAPVSLAPQWKFVTLAVAGVPACFAVGYALTRVPGVSAVL